MSRLGIFVYGLICYAVSLVVFVYAMGFIGGFLTPTTLDGPPNLPLAAALVIDIGLIVVFSLQHSIMARSGFKRWWTHIVPEAAERSTYVLAELARTRRAVCIVGADRRCRVATFRWGRPPCGHRAVYIRLGIAVLSRLS